jgi:hypothetical protein
MRRLGAGDGSVVARSGSRTGWNGEQDTGDQAGDEDRSAGSIPETVLVVRLGRRNVVVQGRQGDASPFFAAAYRVS